MRNVLITGASRGIGAETARAFAAIGDKVIINYNKSKEKAEALAKEINGVAICADVSDPNQVREMFSRIDRVDVLINNAGIALPIDVITSVSDGDWNRVISTNLSGVFYCSRAALPQMISRKSGVIINISSMWGEVGASCEVAYSASKAGVIGFTKALAKEVGRSGIRVNCVTPGVIDTDMNSNLDETAISELCDETPLSKIGSATDVAKAIIALCDNEFITGQVLGVNGGMVV